MVQQADRGCKTVSGVGILFFFYRNDTGSVLGMERVKEIPKLFFFSQCVSMINDYGSDWFNLHAVPIIYHRSRKPLCFVDKT